MNIASGTLKTVVHTSSITEYTLEADAQAIIVVLLSEGEQSVTVRLVGKGSSAHIVGIGNLENNESVILHTLQHHEAPETTSNLLVKAVLRDTASLVYDGAIMVDKKAQKTNAYQRNENLLLSDTAYAQSKPSLEILANDVRCTHGATISTVDPEQLFFLASRGIDEPTGKLLIVQGFLESVFSHIQETTDLIKIKENIWQNLLKQLQ